MQPIDPANSIEGFISQPERSVDGKPRHGRLTLNDVQWVRNPRETIVRTNVTLQQLIEAVDGYMLWTDQDVQRGIKPESLGSPQSELPLAAGYPDKRYIFDTEKADDIAQKILDGDSLHLHPLTWNMRPGTFKAYWDEGERSVYIYSGKIYLPDSHHRHQGIIKAARLFFENREEYPRFSLTELSIDVYFMTKLDEGEFFFEKNILQKQPSKSKAFDLTLQDAQAVIAKRIIEKTPCLQGNVNRVTDNLAGRNPQVMTLSTLRGIVGSVVKEQYLPENEVESYSLWISDFYKLMVRVRPELGHLDLGERRRVREQLLVDQAVVLQGLAAVIARFVGDVRKNSIEVALDRWASVLTVLSRDQPFQYKDFTGDYFSRSNPIWTEQGVLQPTKSGGNAVSNTRQTRETRSRLLLEHLGLEP